MEYLLMLLGAGTLIYVVLKLKKILNFDNTEGLSTEREFGGIKVVKEEIEEVKIDE